MHRKQLVLAVAPLAALLALLYLLLEQGYVRFNYPSRSEFPVQGIDVSHHQGVVDWTEVAQSGVRFAYIKASEGRTLRDPRFGRNWAEARRAGIIAGPYHFYSLCVPGAAQAAAFLSAAPPDSLPSLPPAVDLEFGGNCAARPDQATLERELQAFLTRVEAAWGRRAVIYATRDFYDAHLRHAFTSNPLWIRNIFTRPPPSTRDWSLWQCGNRGRIKGIGGAVDLNVFNGTEEAFRSFIRPNNSVPGT